MSFADKDNINLKKFVEEVHKRPVLWNVNCAEYKEKKRRKFAWDEICRVFHEDYDTKSNVEKSGISFTMSSKWRNVRDNYMRVHRNASTKKKKNNRKPYVHGNLLHFLDQIVEDRYKRNPKDTECSTEDENENLNTIESEEVDIKSEDTIDHVLNDYYEEPEPSEQTQTPRNNDEDDDMAFYRSTLPMVRNMSQEQKIEFRIQVMNLIQNCLNKNNNSS